MLLKDISKQYGSKLALDDINLEFKENGLVFILGESGSGKTTLLNLIGGLDRPTNGQIMFDDIDITSLDNSKLDDYRFSNIGFVFQEYNLLNELTVKENISLVLNMRGIKDIEKKMEDYFSLVDLDYNYFKNKKVYNCSGGERQRIAILRALIKNPKVILCDEPTGSLDSENSRLVFNTLRKIAEDHLVIVVSHDEELAKEYASRIIYLADGKVIKDENILKIKEIDVKISFNKSRLPLKQMLKVGLSNYKKHPIRLIFSLLFLIIASTLFMITLNFSFFNQKDMELNYAENADIDLAIIDKNKYERDTENTVFTGAIDTLFIDSYLPSPLILTADDVSMLNNLTDDLVIMFDERPITYAGKKDNSIYDLDEKLEFFKELERKGEKNNYNPSGYAYTDYEKFSKELDIIGRCPISDDEILLNSRYFELFKMFGYRDINTGARIDINNYEDLIGKTIHFTLGIDSFQKVVGIYEGDNIKFEISDGSSDEHDYYNSAYVTENCFYETRSYYDSTAHSIFDRPHCYLVRPNAEVLKWIINYNYDFFDNRGEDDSFISYSIREETDYFSNVRVFFRSLTFYGNFFNTLGVIFVLIAILLLYNMFSNFIYKQRKQIDILKTLGVNKLSINSIYIGIALIEDIFVIIVSSLLCLFIIPTLSNMFVYEDSNYHFLKMNISVPIIILLISIVVMIITLIIPLMRLNKKTPIQIISEGKGK